MVLGAAKIGVWTLFVAMTTMQTEVPEYRVQDLSWQVDDSWVRHAVVYCQSVVALIFSRAGVYHDLGMGSHISGGWEPKRATCQTCRAESGIAWSACQCATTCVLLPGQSLI